MWRYPSWVCCGLLVCDNMRVLTASWCNELFVAFCFFAGSHCGAIEISNGSLARTRVHQSVEPICEDGFSAFGEKASCGINGWSYNELMCISSKSRVLFRRRFHSPFHVEHLRIRSTGFAAALQSTREVHHTLRLVNRGLRKHYSLFDIVYSISGTTLTPPPPPPPVKFE